QVGAAQQGDTLGVRRERQTFVLQAGKQKSVNGRAYALHVANAGDHGPPGTLKRPMVACRYPVRRGGHALSRSVPSDPFANDLDLLAAQLVLAGRHLAAFDLFDQSAFFRRSFDQDRSLVTPFEECGCRAQIEPALWFLRPMALDTIRREDGQ